MLKSLYVAVGKGDAPGFTEKLGGGITTNSQKATETWSVMRSGDNAV